MKILKIYQQKLRYKNYSERTVETYLHYFQKFLEEENIKDPYQVTLAKLQEYLTYKSYSSISHQNQVIGALKLYAKYILNKTEVHLRKIERPKKQHPLPKVIDADVLREKILNIPNLKHKAILALGFSCALRVSEVIALKMCDIDRDRMLITIKNAKGRKDRVVKLSENLLEILDQYYKAYRPKTHLFNGQFASQYSASSCNKLMKKYISKNSHFHMLRHSGATAMLESGVDIMKISKLMGHKSVKTTQIYTYVSVDSIKNIPCPI